MLSVKGAETVGGHVVCRPVGELDLSAAPTLRQALADVPSGSRVLIDLSDVSFVDSAGLGALIAGIRRTRDRGGEAAVACSRPGLRRLLRTIDLDLLVTISEDGEQAIGALCGTTLTNRDDIRAGSGRRSAVKTSASLSDGRDRLRVS
jgi:anti-anti-sigma factor